MSSKLYVITGGPGVGKTTLIKALEEDGYNIVPEAARVIIQQEKAINGDGLPWKNKERYTDLILEASFRDYLRIINDHRDGICFFDRSIYDAICYAGMIGYTLSEQIMKKVPDCAYNRRVFILPPWPEIYETDNERKQTWEEAEYTFTQMKMTYLQYGYEVIDIPKDTVSSRKEFVLKHIVTNQSP